MQGRNRPVEIMLQVWLDGHQAIGCTNPVHCVLCAAKGRKSDHRAGSGPCRTDPVDKPSQLRKEETADMQIDETADMQIDELEGRSGTEDFSNA